MIITVEIEVLLVGFACASLTIIGVALTKALKETRDDK